MTVFETLSEVQQKALRREAKPSKGTLAALERAGLVTPADGLTSDFSFMLTDLGWLVLLQQRQVANRITKFPPGTEVVELDLRWHNGALECDGQVSIVAYVTTAMVCIEERDGSRRRVNPRSLALLDDLLAAGLGRVVGR